MHEVVSGLLDAVNRVADVKLLVIICNSSAVFIYTTAFLKLATQKLYTEGRVASV